MLFTVHVLSFKKFCKSFILVAVVFYSLRFHVSVFTLLVSSAFEVTTIWRYTNVYIIIIIIICGILLYYQCVCDSFD